MYDVSEAAMKRHPNMDARKTAYANAKNMQYVQRN